MRPLEIILPVLIAIYFLWRSPRPYWIRMLPVCALLIAGIHLMLEGYRWQMIPLYVLTGLLAMMESMRTRSAADTSPFRSLLRLILLAMTTALPILLPVPSIPDSSGPYRVGTRIYELTDASREEIYSGKDDTSPPTPLPLENYPGTAGQGKCSGQECQGARRFQLQIWYPSAPDPGDERAPWMANAEIFAPAIATYIHMPPFFLDHLKLVRMPAYQDSKIAPAEERYPVILFSHGWNGFNAQNTGQAIELASHGYVVVGVQHTYGSVITVFEDGTIARNNPSALPSGAPDDEYDAAAQTLARQWAGDLAHTVDFLEEENGDPGSPFYSALNVSRLGVYGHSTGGGAAIQFCGTDARCKALLGMDPFMRPVSPDVLESGVPQPAFFMFSQRWADDTDSLNNRRFDQFIVNVPETLGVISIDGTAHYDFSDLPLLSPLAPRLGLKGPINGARVTTIINDYLLSFFDQVLKSVPSGLFEGREQKYDEVRSGT